MNIALSGCLAGVAIGAGILHWMLGESVIDAFTGVGLVAIGLALVFATLDTFK